MENNGLVPIVYCWVISMYTINRQPSGMTHNLWGEHYLYRPDKHNLVTYSISLWQKLVGKTYNILGVCLNIWFLFCV